MKNIVRVMQTGDGAYIHPTEGDINYGMIKLYQPSSKINSTNFLNEVSNKWFTIVGQVQGLENWLDEWMDENGRVPGRIFIREFAESHIPETYKKMFFNKTDDDPCERFLKRAGGDDPKTKEKAPVLMYNADRICVFKIYVRQKQKWEDMDDTFITHTNVEEVNEWREAKGFVEGDINETPDLK